MAGGIARIKSNGPNGPLYGRISALHLSSSAILFPSATRPNNGPSTGDPPMIEGRAEWSSGNGTAVVLCYVSPGKVFPKWKMIITNKK